MTTLYPSDHQQLLPCRSFIYPYRRSAQDDEALGGSNTVIVWGMFKLKQRARVSGLPQKRNNPRRDIRASGHRGEGGIARVSFETIVVVTIWGEISGLHIVLKSTIRVPNIIVTQSPHASNGR